jgi:hypothetical protein
VPDLLVGNYATRLLPKKETDHDDDRVWSDDVTGNDAISLPTAKEKAARCHVVAGNDVTTSSSKETAARYACTWPGCRKTFVQRRSVRTHQHNVHTARPVRCAECGKLYSNLANLKTHR